MDPKAGYSMFGPKVGSKGLVLRLGLEVGSRGKVPSMSPIPRLGSMVGFHGWVPRFGSQGLVSRQCLVVGF